MAWVEFEQRINGMPVFQGLIRGGFTRKGELARTTGPLASGLNPAALPTDAAIDGARGGFARGGARRLERARSDAGPQRRRGRRPAPHLRARVDGRRRQGLAGVLSSGAGRRAAGLGRPRSGAIRMSSSWCSMPRTARCCSART